MLLVLDASPGKAGCPKLARRPTTSLLTTSDRLPQSCRYISAWCECDTVLLRRSYERSDPHSCLATFVRTLSRSLSSVLSGWLGVSAKTYLGESEGAKDGVSVRVNPKVDCLR